MKNFLLILSKYGFHILFLMLEMICLYLIVNYNQTQKEIFINSTNIISRSINSKVDRIQNYLYLEDINDSLQIQNARLLRRYIKSNNLNLSSPDTTNIDSLKYDLISTKTCNSTFHLKNNYLTLCNGKKDGIKPNMGIISVNGIVGQVTKVSTNYSKVMSILHSQSRISAKLKTNGSIGHLRWDGDNPLIVQLEAIPTHESIAIGDTIITSGYSTIFPRGIPIGSIVSFVKGNNVYKINVKLFNDPTKLDVLYAILNHQAEEQLELENAEDI